MTLTAKAWARAAATDACDGPLPGLLLALTIVTGIIDAVSILALGFVFTANMTGNLVFAGFAAAGAPGFSLAAPAAALATYSWRAGRLPPRPAVGQ
jgi:putative exporter of polyketide antibiotics